MGRNRKKSDVYQQAHVGVSLPRTFDLAARANLARQVQSMIGEFVAGLLTNGKPLTMAISVSKQPSVKNTEDVVLSVYWKEVEFDVPIFRDIQFLNRCLVCGDYVRGEHKCSIPLLNQSESGEGDQSNETKNSQSLPSGETEPVSTD